MKVQKKVGFKKTTQTRKTTRKLNRLQKCGKLKRHIADAFETIKVKKSKESRKRALNIEDDWIHDRETLFKNESDDDLLPLDMVDAEIDWEKSAFASRIRRLKEDENETLEVEKNLRNFSGKKKKKVRERLPIKVDGKLIHQCSEFEIDNDLLDNDELDSAEQIMQDENLSEMTIIELTAERNRLLESAKLTLSNNANSIISDPQNEISKLKEIFRTCWGENLHCLIREELMLLATLSMTEIFIHIIPGYRIRSSTQEEMSSQKMKKETKRLFEYEKSLLNLYEKYLQFLEKNCSKFSTRRQNFDSSCFAYRLSKTCLKCLCRLLISLSHFNYATNLIDCIARLSFSSDDWVVNKCCETLGTLFKKDFFYRLSAHGARSIANLVLKKKANIPVRLIATFLNLTIKEINNEDVEKEKNKIINRKIQLTKEKNSKSKRKYSKQLKKLETDLLEIEAEESLSTKKKYATETMNHVFATYFRVIKRLPTTNLLGEVLNGLSKFAHLLNVEFFGDIVTALGSLIDQKRLCLVDSLHCVNVVFIILSEQGVALNIDPCRFYRLMYRLLPIIPFEKRKEDIQSILIFTLKSLDLMLIARRKFVSIDRVAAFVKRLLTISFVVHEDATIAILSFLRAVFISHPRLNSSLENGDEIYCDGLFNVESDDPDCCNGQAISVAAEFDILSNHNNPVIKLFAMNIRKGLPSNGRFALSTHLTTKKPCDWIGEIESNTINHGFFLEEIICFAAKQNKQFNSKTLPLLLKEWIDSTISTIKS